MKKIVFFCIPAHGHTNPTLGVVRELVQRGHQVWYYSYELMRHKIEEAGATFVPCDAYDAEMKLTPKDGARLGKDLAFSTKILVETTLALDEAIYRDMEVLQPDCIVADSMAVWGKAIALKMGIPFVSSTTTFAFNQHSAKIMKQEIGDMVRMLLSMPKINRQIRRLREKGYPIRNVLDIIQNDDHTHTVVYTSAGFQPCADTFSKEHYAFVGPSVRKPMERVEKQGKQLVYISMGTVNNDMLGFYKACIEAFAEKDLQVIISVGDQVSLAAFGKLPDNISIHARVDQIAVLEQADVFLTHCGMNSVSESLYYGVPMVLLPKTPEQQGVATRTAQIGAGITLEKETPAAIFEAVQTILKTPSYRQNAKATAEDFRACPGAAGAADKILSICP